jgi:uncharacterized integral membrane protein
MDTFTEVWFLLSDHIQANLKLYILGIVLAVPFVYFTRKWTVPLILYSIEICIYFLIMHVFVHCAVIVTAWFKTNSSIRALRKDGMPTDAVFWTTPMAKFWDKTLYDPEWIVYMEYAFMAIIVILVFKYRPMHTQKPKPRFGIDGTRRSESEKDAQAVAHKYGSRRYADDWDKGAVKPTREGRIRK